MSSIEKILQFIEFTHIFQSVERIIYVKGTERDENDAEHSYQLALLAWYIIESKKLPLDVTKVIKYSLAHDLVEAYAGDTFFYTQDQSERDSKQEREAVAANRIKKEFPDFTELHHIIHEYEERADPEAKFVYALDKIIPVLNIYSDGGRTWRRDKVTYQMLREGKDSKVAMDTDVEEIWRELTALLEKDEENLFPKER